MFLMAIEGIFFFLIIFYILAILMINKIKTTAWDIYTAVDLFDKKVIAVSFFFVTIVLGMQLFPEQEYLRYILYIIAPLILVLIIKSIVVACLIKKSK